MSNIILKPRKYRILKRGENEFKLQWKRGWAWETHRSCPRALDMLLDERDTVFPSEAAAMLAIGREERLRRIDAEFREKQRQPWVVVRTILSTELDQEGNPS